MSRTRELLIAATLCIGLVGSAHAIPALVCANVTDCSYTRSTDFWFGTLTPQGVGAPAQDFLEATDHTPRTLQDGIAADPAVDPRVIAGMPAFANAMGAIEWVITDPEGLPAQANLLASYANAATTLSGLYGPGALTLSAVASSGSTYELATTTIFCGPGVSDDDPSCAGSGDSLIERTLRYLANVGYFEQNATWRPDAVSVPEPGTGTLLALGLIAMWFRRPARRKEES